QLASGQMRPALGGTTPSGAIFDHLNDATTHPMPQAPSPTIPTPESTWVPDRYVQVPGTDGPVMVPGHWERRLSDPRGVHAAAARSNPERRHHQLPGRRSAPDRRKASSMTMNARSLLSAGLLALTAVATTACGAM